MKKLVLGVSAMLIAFSFLGCCNHNTQKLAAPAPFNNRTLNGVDSATAVSMIDTFQKYNKKYIGSKAVSIWLNKDQLYNIDTLLQTEAKTKGADGVRFYFACNPPAVGTNSLDVSIVMVSTRQRKTPPDPKGGGSSHIDYYGHEAAYLNSGLIGTPSQGPNVPGAELYYPTGCTEDVCDNASVHYIDCHTSHDWVQNRLKNTDTINTYSEWFNLCWIQSLFKAIYKADRGRHINGLRIYLAMGDVPQDTIWRDVFLLAPTYDNNGIPTDFFECLEDFTPLCDSTKSHLMRQKLSAVEKKKHPFWMGGYDNGEMCPNSCN